MRPLSLCAVWILRDFLCQFEAILGPGQKKKKENRHRNLSEIIALEIDFFKKPTNFEL